MFAVWSISGHLFYLSPLQDRAKRGMSECPKCLSFAPPIMGQKMTKKNSNGSNGNGAQTPPEIAPEDAEFLNPGAHFPTSNPTTQSDKLSTEITNEEIALDGSLSPMDPDPPIPRQISTKFPKPTRRGVFFAIKHLPRFKEVHEMLEQGRSLAFVARMIQNDWGLLQDMSFYALEKTLLRYRASMVKPGVRPDGMDWAWLDRIRAQVGDQKTLLDRMGWAINIQTERVATGLVAERDGDGIGAIDGRRDPGLAREIRLLADMLVEQAEVMFRSGVIREMPKAVAVAGRFQVLGGGVSQDEGEEAGGRPVRLALEAEERARLPLARATRELFDFLEDGRLPNGFETFSRAGKVLEAAVLDDEVGKSGEVNCKRVQEGGDAVAEAKKRGE